MTHPNETNLNRFFIKRKWDKIKGLTSVSCNPQTTVCFSLAAFTSAGQSHRVIK